MRILVFAKAPVAGRVKTRLIPALGAEGAAQLHRRLVHRALAAATCAHPGGVELWCAPDADHAFFGECRDAHGCRLRSQCSGDLGARMRHAFEAEGAAGFPAVLLGADAPGLDAQRLRAAAREVQQGARALLVPALDGGYVLIGLGRPAASLFEGIDWGTDKVVAQTRVRAVEAGITLKEVEACADIDRPEDLGHCIPDLLRGLAHEKYE
jgi:rSAM/selenodomain-associated transferase 1